MLRVALRLAAVLIFLGVVAVGGAAYWAYQDLHTPHAGWEGESVDLVLEPGLSARAMLDRLAEAGVIRRPRLARAWLSWHDRGQRLHAGEYRFDRASNAVEVLERLELGDVLLHPVTVPEGLNLHETARRFEAGGFGTFAELVAAFGDPAPIADLDPEAEDLEGYLFPDTYSLQLGTQPTEVAAAMVRRFRDEIADDYLALAEAVDLDLRGAVTLASLIEKETSVPDERGRISQVFHNRLDRGMKLECDPTVIYALHRAGREVGRLTYADLRFESPWNTYFIAGLPRGPIANPGGESLRAAIAPTEGDDLFFVAAPGGGHRFSRDMKGHLEAVAEWRRYERSLR
jgi:UPF0755 protein